MRSAPWLALFSLPWWPWCFSVPRLPDAAQLDRAWRLTSSPGPGVQARLGSVERGTVLLADSRRFAAASLRAGMGSVGLVPQAAEWLLRAAAWLKIGGLDLVADAPRYKRLESLQSSVLTCHHILTLYMKYH